MKYSLTLLALSAAGSLPVTLAAVPVWGQCGGRNYNGDTTCEAGSVCTFYQEYYSQCIPGTGQPNNPAPTTVSTVRVSSTSVRSSAAATPTGGNSNPGTHGENCSLQQKMAAKGRYVGVAADPGTLSSADTKKIIIDDFGQVTPENRYVSCS